MCYSSAGWGVFGIAISIAAYNIAKMYFEKGGK